MANMGNIGIGLAAGIQGFGQGVELARTIQGIRREKKYDDIRTKGIEGAQQSRQNDIASQIRATGLGQYQVGGQTFADEAAARKAAEGNVDSLYDYYSRDVMPKLRDAYIADGDIEKAEAYEKWTQDRNTQKGLRNWSKAMAAFNRGDYKGAAKGFMDAENIEGYGAGGVKDAKPIEGEDGKPVGFEFTYVDASGREVTDQVVGDELVRRAILNLSPNAQFEALYGEMTARDEAQAKAAAEARKQGLQLQREVAVEDRRQQGRVELADVNAAHRVNEAGVRQDNAIELEQIKSQLKAAAQSQGADSPLLRDHNAMVQILESTGMSAEQARDEAANRMLYRMSQSPQDRVRSTMSDLARTDLRFSQMTPEEQAARVREVMATEDALVEEISGSRAAPAGRPQAVGRQGGSVPVW